MEQQSYEVIFDVNNGYKNWLLPAFGFIFVGSGVILVLIEKILNFRLKRKLHKSLITIGLAFSILTFGITFSNYHSSLADMRSGNFRIVEGEVKNFKAMPPHGKIYEQFTVGEKTFFYSTYEITPGYSKTRMRGALITDGLLVKVWYNGNTILKLSIRN